MLEHQRVHRVAVVVLLLVTCPALLSASTFSVTDLEGTWRFYVYFDGTLSNDPEWYRGWVILDAAGMAVAGEVETSFGFTDMLDRGALDIDRSGVIWGTIVFCSGLPLIVNNFVLSPDKSIAGGVETEPGYPFVGFFVREESLFSPSDLVGSWSFYELTDEPTTLGGPTNSAEWRRGVLEIDATGAIIGGELEDCGGTVWCIDGDAVGITTTGGMSGSMTLAGGPTIDLVELQLTPDKGVAVGVMFEGPRLKIGMWIKQEGSFSSADLAGAWAVGTFWDAKGPGLNDPGWDRGTIILDADGSVLGGTTESSSCPPDTIIGGMLKIDADGLVSGTVCHSSGFTSDIALYKMDEEKRIIVGTRTELGGPIDPDYALFTHLIKLSHSTFDRGDCNDDGSRNIADAVWALEILFPSAVSFATTACPDSCDSNDDGMFDIADPVYELAYLFTMGPPLPAPAGFCGVDPTPDSLNCEVFDGCP